MQKRKVWQILKNEENKNDWLMTISTSRKCMHWAKSKSVFWKQIETEQGQTVGADNDMAHGYKVQYYILFSTTDGIL